MGNCGSKKGTSRKGSLSPVTAGLVYKVCVIGDADVGKTSSMIQYADGRFPEATEATTGVDSRQKVVTVGKDKVTVNIVDTAGQERFRSITQSIYRGVAGLILMYSIANYESYKGLDQWLEDIRNYTQPDIPILLVGNKTDLSPAKRQVRQEDAEAYAARQKLIGYIETSAKQGTNVEEAFMTLVQKMVEEGRK